jgi:hypothetical protein
VKGLHKVTLYHETTTYDEELEDGYELEGERVLTNVGKFIFL